MENWVPHKYRFVNQGLWEISRVFLALLSNDALCLYSVWPFQRFSIFSCFTTQKVAVIMD